MDISLTGFYQISIALGEHYDSMYYIDVESEMYMEFLPSKLFLNVPHPKSGNKFFKFARQSAKKYVHPNDLNKVLQFYNKKRCWNLLQTKLLSPCSYVWSLTKG